MKQTSRLLLLWAIILPQVTGISEKNGKCFLCKDMFKCENHIPTTIPGGVRKVDLVKVPVGIPITSYLLSGKGWDNITSLAITSYSVAEDVILKADCFRTLNSLDELHIHLLSPLLDTNVFNGLNNLKLLDLSNSTGLYQTDFSRVFIPSSLPRLQKFVLSGLGLKSGYDLNEAFWQQIEAARISYLDISYLQANTIDASAVANHCKHIRTLILRGTFIGAFLKHTSLLESSHNMELLDLSHLQTPGVGPGCFINKISDYKDVVLHLDRLKLFFSVYKLYIDGICDMAGPGILRNLTNIRNVSFEFSFSMNIKSVSVNKNGFAYLDVTSSIRFSKLEWLSASDNSMEYLNPDLLLSVYALKYLDLSRNKLEIMNLQKKQHFKVLLMHLSDLRHINLAENNLTSIHEAFFDYNSNIETIDLSGNKLQQVYLKTKYLKNLRLFNISNNAITVLDQKSLDSLALLLRLPQAKIDMSKNLPFCRECSHLDSVTWLVHHRYDIFDRESIECLNEDGKYVILNEKTIEDVKSICQRRRNIIISSTAGCLCLSLAVIGILLTRRHLKRKKKSNRLTDTLRKFVEQEPGHEFVAFLSFSTDDQDTVLRFILPPLEQKLQQTVGVERDLICLGDKHFRVGYPIYNETMRCLNISCVVLLLFQKVSASASTVETSFCRLTQLKPIILMMKEQCNEDLMPPLLKEMFLRNTRIIWLSNDNCFALKTTWENISMSIISLSAGNV